MNNKKYFISNSIDNPHIFLCFCGDLIQIKQVTRNIILYKFTNIDILESEETINKYINNCTFQFFNNKRSYINVSHKSLDDISKSYRELFKDRYKNKFMFISSILVYDSYDICIEELKKENTNINKVINNMIEDINNRIVNVDNEHIL